MLTNINTNTDKIKEYNKWNEKKQAIELAQEKEILFKEGEIWWSSVGMNVGNEIFGKGEDFTRPVLVFKKLSQNSCIVLPVTTQEKIGSWFTPVTLNGGPRWVMLYQIRMTHVSRFQRRLGQLSPADYSKVRKMLKDFLFEHFSNHHPSHSAE